MRQRKFFTAVLMSIFLNGCPDASTSSQSHAATAEESTPQAAEPSAASGRVGSGAALRVNFTEAAKSADARTRAPSNPDVGDRGEFLELPSVPTTGSRKQASTPGFVTPQTSRILPCVVATVPCPFDGVVQGSCASCTNPPPDPNAAVGAGKIVEVVNNLIQITDRLGAVQCGGAVTLNSFLSTSDGLTDPRVQFDNINQRFSLTVTVSSVTASSTPAMWLATSQSEDPCGGWFLYRATFDGDAYPRGTFLDFPMLGQDTRALLISIRSCLPGKNCFKSDGAIFTIFGLPKSIVYSGAGMNGKTFRVDSLTAPVTNAGQPMIQSPVSFFLAAVPGTGYKLYRLTNSGGPGASLTKKTISASFSKPTRRVNQPGTTADTLDPSDGNITHSPYFDGRFIWFTHGGDVNGFPTVRYGRVDTGNNTVEATWAFHSGSSDDFNPSLAVGITPQRETVYLNWAFTDTTAGTATSALFASGDASKPIVTIAGAGTIYSPAGGIVTGCGKCRFGDFSSVSVDPSVSGCAFATQQYFGTDGNWRTRIAPIGQCENIVIGPTR